MLSSPTTVTVGNSVKNKLDSLTRRMNELIDDEEKKNNDSPKTADTASLSILTALLFAGTGAAIFKSYRCSKRKKENFGR